MVECEAWACKMSICACSGARLESVIENIPRSAADAALGAGSAREGPGGPAGLEGASRR